MLAQQALEQRPIAMIIAIAPEMRKLEMVVKEINLNEIIVDQKNCNKCVASILF